MSGERKDCLSWDEYFMMLAISSSMRSKDPRTQVGACIVDSQNHILSVGYNGTVPGLTDEEMPWDSLGESNNDIMTIKNTFVVHAEANAIANYTGEKSRLNGSSIYVTLFPCLECTKQIITAGIKRLVYLNMYSKHNMVMASQYMMQKAGITYEQFPEEEYKQMKVKVLNKF